MEKMEKIKRSSGILLHITSLPSDFGWGSFSSNAIRFIDKLETGKFGVWQVLPFADTLYGNSPYSAVSSFAINPVFIDVTKYLNDDEINSFEIRGADTLDEYSDRVKSSLKLICEKNRDIDISAFEKHNAYWLDDYALFKAIKNNQNNLPWFEWSDGLKNRKPNALLKFKTEHEKEIKDYKIIQYLLDRDWSEIKKYANDRNIEIFGDMPFYVELDSAEVWANPKNWQLIDGKPKCKAGVPPDYFNEDGQLWGYPIYDYVNMAKNKYSFWVNRVKRLGELFDIIRIDHFVAFSRYWSVPAGAETAKSGKWIKNEGDSILKEIVSKVKVKIVAEDLGIVTDDVNKLKNKFNIAGVKVLEFAFDADGDNDYQPHNFEKNCVAYIGTHDNDTFMGLLGEGNWDKINRFKRYLNLPLEYGNDAVVDKAMLDLYKSSANMVIFTMQDILKLGSDARMNVPGVRDGNWSWRMPNCLNSIDFGKYAEWSRLYARK